MTTVKSRAEEVKQPRGGYLKPSQFEVISIDDGRVLGDENLSAGIVGLAVDYLTRAVLGTPVEEAFSVSVMGYCVYSLQPQNQYNLLCEDIDSILARIRGLDDESIIAACEAVQYDGWYRNPCAMAAYGYSELRYPDDDTIRNIRIMVERCVAYLRENGPVTKTGFDFKPRGYTRIVGNGDGDVLTANGLWDLKTNKTRPNSKQTLQLLMYWIMGQHSGQKMFRNARYIGLINPRLGVVYRFDMNEMDEEIISVVENEVIGY